ncbi:MAG TPA: ECF-type sigma factor [Longimicrobiales bacterium]
MSTGEVTRLLGAVRNGDREALDALLPHVYDELRAAARVQLHRVRNDPALQPTAVVHEAYMKLVRTNGIAAADRAHFLAIAAAAMRQVLVDHARAMLSRKRGGGWKQTRLTAGSRTYELSPEDVIALDRALATLDERQRQVVECRYFAGMEEKEIADALGISDRTVRREWVKARAWLYSSLYGGEGGAQSEEQSRQD